MFKNIIMVKLFTQYCFRVLQRLLEIMKIQFKTECIKKNCSIKIGNIFQFRFKINIIIIIAVVVIIIIFGFSLSQCLPIWNLWRYWDGCVGYSARMTKFFILGIYSSVYVLEYCTNCETLNFSACFSWNIDYYLSKSNCKFEVTFKAPSLRHFLFFFEWNYPI